VGGGLSGAGKLLAGKCAAEGIESVLFVLRQPPWKSKAADGDPRFWKARGVVRDFLSRLYDVALAPVDISRRVSTSIWNKETLQFKYLYVKDVAALRRLVGKQTPAQFFRDLESTYVSELIEEVRIRVRLKKNDGSVTFRELSEGGRTHANGIEGFLARHQPVVPHGKTLPGARGQCVVVRTETQGTTRSANGLEASLPA
jgi:hypothetical protein